MKKYDELINDASRKKDNVRNDRLVIRLTSEELASFRAACARAGVNPSKIVREFINDFSAENNK